MPEKGRYQPDALWVLTNPVLAYYGKLQENRSWFDKSPFFIHTKFFWSKKKSGKKVKTMK